ncbi:MAG: hypothetical protein GKR89_18465 [Candidatus Latescibacteria bacterium]|nr:hypothetical protein [Candidatus Latescibacterota bacterium]
MNRQAGPKLKRSHITFFFTRCVYIETLRAYGMMSCYCDHIIFDNAMPEIYFRRDNCKGVGDSFCNHYFKIRTPEGAARDDQRYDDTEKAPFDARGIIQYWRDNYRENGGQFKW